jgi:glyoxylase-like metal-dependent hydrolase (beta-lactamase superfamily II)
MATGKQQELAEIIQVKVPLPFPLRWVNSYLIRGKHGLTLIDPGLHTLEAEQLWDETLARYELQYTDIEQIVLTHYHPDHYGMAGWFQQRAGGIPVWISREGNEQAERLWGAGQPLALEISQLFLRHGMNAAMVQDELIPHMNNFVAWVTPAPQVSLIPLAEPFRLGDRFYEPLVTPGHAEGHICFYDAQRKEIFCGDHVLPQLSPNVSFIPGADPNPLDSFLTSLAYISSYEVVMAYPGHREPFTAFTERVLELIAHHEDRLVKMAAHLDEPMSAYQLCLDFFGARLPIHQMRFALSETLAHLIYLEQKGRVVKSERDGVVYYCNLEGEL